MLLSVAALMVSEITCRRRSSYLRPGHIPFYLFWFGWESFWLSKETDGCDFGWKQNRMDVVKFGGITSIDDMA
jgi:hypothetical protein